VVASSQAGHEPSDQAYVDSGAGGALRERIREW
jgi:hypothetical protein